MRIVAGTCRGRALRVPHGDITRPTADRVRQALFDKLWHAPWGGRARFGGAHVLDLFAGTGALGLEALSRGAARASFVEHDREALTALRANIAICRMEPIASVREANCTAPAPGGELFHLIFLDPPYQAGLLLPAIAAWSKRFATGAILVAEMGRAEEIEVPGEPLDEMQHGAAKIVFTRWG